MMEKSTSVTWNQVERCSNVSHKPGGLTVRFAISCTIFVLQNRPIAGSGHMVRNKLYAGTQIT